MSAEATALRRLERDIHDGPQQRLVRLAMDLGRAQHQLDTDPEAARATVDEALTQTRETLDELRALSRGIAPPILVDRGLPSAVAALAGPVHRPRRPGSPGADGRLDPAAEINCLFRGGRGADQRREAQHGHGLPHRHARDNGHLEVSVADDGVGGATSPRGTASRGWPTGYTRPAAR